MHCYQEMEQFYILSLEVVDETSSMQCSLLGIRSALCGRPYGRERTSDGEATATGVKVGFACHFRHLVGFSVLLWF